MDLNPKFVIHLFLRNSLISNKENDQLLKLGVLDALAPT